MANDAPRDRARGGPDRRDRSRDRDSYRDRDRDHRGGDRQHTPQDRRSRSRSPRHQRGGRRSDNRYRSRSPVHKERGRDARDVKDRARDGRDRDYRGALPTGLRGAGRDGRDGRDRDTRIRSKSPARPPYGRDVKHGAVKHEEEDKDVAMGNTATANDSGPPEGVDEDTWEMIKVMGFGTFKSTKETKVPGNDKNYGVRRDKKMEARQYMNRQGGFNRPLSPGR